MKKRTLALVLAVCMTAALLSGMAVATEPAVTVNCLVDAANPLALSIDENGFEVNLTCTSTAIPTRTGNFAQTAALGTKCDMGVGETFALDFNVPTSGNYILAVSGFTVASYGAIGDVYFYGRTPLGSISFSDSATSDVTPFTTTMTGSVYLQSGINTLIFKKTGGGSYTWFSGWTLTPVEQAIPSVTAYNFKASGTSVPTDATLAVHGFAVDSENTSAAIATRAGNYLLDSGNGLKMEMAYGEKMTFDININASGWYRLDANGLRYEMYGANLGFSFNDGATIGSFNFSTDSETGNAVETKQLGYVYLEAGANKMVLTRINSGDYRHAYTWLYGVTLTPSEPEPVAQSLNFKAAGTSVPTDATLAVHGFAVDTENTSAGIATRTGNYLLDSGNGLKMEIAYGEKMTFDININSSGWYRLDANGLRYENFGANLGFSFNDGATIGSFNFSTDSETGNAVETKQLGYVYLEAGANKMVLTRINSGDYRHAYTWLYSVTFTPEEPAASELTVNFKTSGTSVPTDAALAVHGFELDTAKTSPALSSRSNYALTELAGAKFEFAEGEYATFKTNVGIAGTYAVEVTGWQVGNFGATIDFAFNDVLAGTFNFSDETDNENKDTNNVTKKLGYVTLNAGINEIKLTRVNSGDYRHAYTWLHSIRLIPSVRADVSTESFFVNPNDTITYNVNLLSGEEESINGYNLALSYDNTRYTLVGDVTGGSASGSSISFTSASAANVTSDGLAVGTFTLKANDAISDGMDAVSFTTSEITLDETKTIPSSGASVCSRNVIVTFVGGENATIEGGDVTYYAKYNQPGIYTTSARDVAASLPTATPATSDYVIGTPAWISGTVGYSDSYKVIGNTTFTANTVDAHPKAAEFKEYGSVVPTGKKLAVLTMEGIENISSEAFAIYWSDKYNAFVGFVDSASDDTAVKNSFAPTLEARVSVPYGKVSADDSIDTLDAVMVQRLYNGSFTTASDLQILSSDFNGDYSVDTQDAIAIVGAYVIS